MFRLLTFIVRPSFLFIPPDDGPYGSKHIPDKLRVLLNDSAKAQLDESHQNREKMNDGEYLI